MAHHLERVVLAFNGSPKHEVKYVARPYVHTMNERAGHSMNMRIAACNDRQLRRFGALPALYRASERE